MTEVVISKAGASIRLTEERWAHIAEEHGELLGMRSRVQDTVAHPTCVYAGQAGELLATKQVEAGKWLVVVYRETGDDGFIITGFLTRRIGALERRKQVWP
jgi:hypothetical protein